MNAEYLLDCVGMLDDGLIREAEEYRRPRRNYSRWISLAACLAVALTLGYGVTHMGMGGGGAAPEGWSGGAAENRPAASAPAELPTATDDSSQGGGSPDLSAPGSADWLSAIRVDGVVYWATNEYIHLEPEEDDIRYTTSFINSAEPEEDGQANFLPVGRAYVVLDNGTAAVYQEDNDTWRVFDPVPPWEQ